LPFLSERSSFLAPAGSSSPCDAAQAAHMALSVISWGHCTCGYQATRRPERDQAAQTHAAASASSGAGQPHRPASPARSLRRGQRWRGHKGSRGAPSWDAAACHSLPSHRPSRCHLSRDRSWS
jgi:hypothetical protein